MIPDVNVQENYRGGGSGYFTTPTPWCSTQYRALAKLTEPDRIFLDEPGNFEGLMGSEYFIRPHPLAHFGLRYPALDYSAEPCAILSIAREENCVRVGEAGVFHPTPPLREPCEAEP